MPDSSERRFSFSAFHLIVAGLLVTAAVVRLWNIGSVPLELHPDEMGPYTGVRDMLIGHRPFAVFIESDVVYLPLYGVFELVSSWLFGDGTSALRLPGALLGVATALGTALLAFSFVRSRVVFAVACGIMAILPWDVMVSRIGWEPAAMLPFVLFGLYALRRGLVSANGRFVVCGCVLLALSTYSYRAAAFDAFALGFALIAIEFRRSWRVRGALGIGVGAAVAIVLPLVVAALTHPAYLSSGPAQMTFANGVNADTIHNFEHRYLAQFSPAALFADGDGNLQHGPAGGVLYPWMLPFVVLGFLAPRLLELRTRLFLYAWLLVYPVGNGLVNEVPQQHFVRTLIGAPLFTIFAALGCLVAWQWLRGLGIGRLGRTAVLATFATLVFGQFAQFGYAYFVRYPEASADAFQYGDRAIFAFVRSRGGEYSRVCFTAVGGWNWTTLTRYYMADSSLELHARIDTVCAQPHTLFGVEKLGDAPKDAQLLGTVQRRDGTIRAWFLGT